MLGKTCHGTHRASAVAQATADATLGNGARILRAAVKTALTALGLGQKTAKRLGEALCGVCFRHRQTSKEETADFLG